METRIYDVSDLVVPPSSYPFQGMYIPEARGGRVGAGGGMEGVSGPGTMSGGMGTVAMGGVASVRKEDNRTGGRMGGGLFAVVEPLPPGEGNEPAKPSSPAPQKEPPKPATPGGWARGGYGRRQGRRNGRYGRRYGRHGRRPRPWRCWWAATSTASQRDFDSLIDLIKSTVKPTSLGCVGGPGTIAPLDGPTGMLVFSQTQDDAPKDRKVAGRDPRGQSESATGDRACPLAAPGHEAA